MWQLGAVHKTCCGTIFGQYLGIEDNKQQQRQILLPTTFRSLRVTAFQKGNKLISKEEFQDLYNIDESCLITIFDHLCFVVEEKENFTRLTQMEKKIEFNFAHTFFNFVGLLYTKNVSLGLTKIDH